MAATALLDFGAVDLSREVVSIETIRTINKQRGRMEILQGLLHFDEEGDLIVGYRDVGKDEWWVDDHIPGRPVYPGVLMIEGAAQLCSYDFLRRHPEHQGTFVGYGGLNETRFRGIVSPGQRIIWAARAMRIRRTMFTYQSQAFCGEKLVFESEIMGVIV
jgi:3-hydroxyacyl-[acyl-carrier-protein] dehydratase